MNKKIKIHSNNSIKNTNLIFTKVEKKQTIQRKK